MLLCPVQFIFCIEELAAPTQEPKWHCTRCWISMVQLNGILSWSQWRLNGYNVRPDLTRYIISVDSSNAVSYRTRLVNDSIQYFYCSAVTVLQILKNNLTHCIFRLLNTRDETIQHQQGHDQIYLSHF